MSQYIPGIVDYIPQIQPFKPDLNFFQQVLETKEAQYKAGYDKLSSLYGELLNSPMSRNENIELRNKFFQDISSDITKISALDLSLNQNIEAAQKVFQPLVDNKYILKDMAYTKQGYDAISRGMDYLNCIDEKKCGGKYWEGGIRLINYQMKDFAESSAEESLEFSSPTYVPAVNLPKQAMEFAKELGLGTRYIERSPDGRYLITTKNGAKMVPSLTNIFISAFQNDQSAIDYYNAKASLDRYDWSYQNAEQYGGSRQAAENYYLDEMSKSLFNINDAKEKSAESDKNTARRNKSVAEQIVKDKGVDPDDPNDSALIDSYNQTIVDELIAAQAENHYKLTKEYVNPEISNITNLNAKRARVDSAVANSLFQTDLFNAANSYAEATYEEIDIKADPYTMANYEHSLAIDRMIKQGQIDIEVDNARTTNEILKEGYKDKKGKRGAALGNSEMYEPNNYIELSTGAGGVAEEGDLFKADEKVLDTTLGDVNQTLTQTLKLLDIELNSIINAKIGDKVNGVVVTKDMIELAKEKRDYVFGPSGKVEKEYKTDKANLAWYKKLYNALVPAYYETFDWVEEEKVVGGYLDANGRLIANLDKQLSWTDPKSKNNWWSIADRMNSVLTDPTFRALSSNLTGQQGALGNYRRAYDTYKANEKIRKNNISSTHSAALSAAGDASVTEMVSSLSDPIYASRQIAENYLTEDGYIRDKESFVKKYVKQIWFGDQRFGQVYRDFYQPNYTAGIREEAEDLYDSYTEHFNNIYNNLDGAVISNPDYKPLAIGYKRNITPGKGIEAGSLRVRNIDSAYPGDLGALDIRDVYQNIITAYNNDRSSVQIIGKDGREITGDVFDDYDDYTLDSQPTNKRTLDLINSHLSAGRDEKDKKRIRLDYFDLHPIIANNAEKVGFTFKLNPETLLENAGSKNKPGTLTGADEVFTVIMNRADVTADLYKRLNKGKGETLIDAYGYADIKEFSQYGGEITVKPSAGGGYEANGFWLSYDENGNFVRNIYATPSGAYASADQLLSESADFLKEVYSINYDRKDLFPRNRITDPNSLIRK